MKNLVSREEIRRLKRAVKDNNPQILADWLMQYSNQVDMLLRREYESAYQDEILNSERNMLTAVVYALYFSEENYIDKENLPDFMADLFETLNMYRTGEYTPQEYADILKDAHIILDDYDSAEIYKKYLNILDTDLVNFLKGKHRKLITICGDNKYQDDILDVYQTLSIQVYIVLMDSIIDKDAKVFDEEKKLLVKMHKDKILISDAIFVINKNKEIDATTQEYIDYAKEHNKEIQYLENIN